MRRIHAKRAFRAVMVTGIAFVLLVTVSIVADAARTGSKKNKTYQVPEFMESSYFGEMAESEGEVCLDLTSCEEGYVGFSAVAGHHLKVQIMKDDLTYTYDLANDGSPSIYPLQMDDGNYYYRVLENVSGTKYSMVDDGDFDVTLDDEYQPFLRPNDYVNYSEKDECVKKAGELSKGAETALDVVKNIFNYICENVDYDKEKAATVKSGYLPDPDETLSSGKGICFDYASLAAAMLRSQGIPSKLVFGYVSPDNVYHAWNMFYTEDTGWVNVEYKVDKNSWNRLDPTFSSGGAPTEFIGNGGNYADVYYY